MGKKSKVRLNIDSKRLREIMHGRMTLVDLSEKCGVSKQAVNAWLEDGLMSPRGLVEILRATDLTTQEMEEILAPQNNGRRIRITITVEKP